MKKRSDSGRGFRRLTAIAVILVMMVSVIFTGCSKSENRSDSITDTSETKGRTGSRDTSAASDRSGTSDSSGISGKSPFGRSDTSGPDLPAATAAPGMADTYGTAGESEGSSSGDLLSRIAEFKATAKDSSAPTSSYDEGSADYDLSYGGDFFGGDFSGGLSDRMAGDDYAIDSTEGFIPEYDTEFPTDRLDPWEEMPNITPVAGLLTAGEWNDNLHFDFLKNLLSNGQQQDYSSFFKAWDLAPFSRLAIHVSTGDIITTVSGTAIGASNVSNATVKVYSADGNVIWQSKTDNKGMTYAFYRLTGGDAVPAKVTVSSGAFTAEKTVESADLQDDSILEIVLSNSMLASKKLDLMFVIDTTGSMGDEILYLQKELEDVIERVERDNANLPIRLSVNFYRDLEDAYVVRSNEFSSDINSQLVSLNSEYADGGGDWEEAVELALEDAVNKHSWEEDSVKLMFMVLDAPPHNTSDIRKSLAASITDAVNKGIRIIPVASSGIDKGTEFLLRTFAMTTGGTYTFLTDDSGIGGSHIEPTIGDYEVENLNDLLVRVINGYLS